jgi:hypothetical protein
VRVMPDGSKMRSCARLSNDLPVLFSANRATYW